MRNEMTVHVELTRLELCDLLIACLSAHEKSGAEKWITLHQKLQKQLNDFDSEIDAYRSFIMGE